MLLPSMSECCSRCPQEDKTTKSSMRESFFGLRTRKSPAQSSASLRPADFLSVQMSFDMCFTQSRTVAVAACQQCWRQSMTRDTRNSFWTKKTKSRNLAFCTKKTKFTILDEIWTKTANLSPNLTPSLIEVRRKGV